MKEAIFIVICFSFLQCNTEKKKEIVAEDNKPGWNDTSYVFSSDDIIEEIPEGFRFDTITTRISKTETEIFIKPVLLQKEFSLVEKLLQKEIQKQWHKHDEVVPDSSDAGEPVTGETT